MKKKLFLPFLWPVLLMVFIFVFSAMPAEKSDQQSGLIVDTIRAIFPDLTDVKLITTIVRKLAHFTEYTTLGFLFARALDKTSRAEREEEYIKEHDKDIKKRIAIYAVGLTTVVATGDEIHQMFVQGRSAEVRDVFIDFTGGCTGVALYFLWKHLVKKHKEKKLAKINIIK